MHTAHSRGQLSQNGHGVQTRRIQHVTYINSRSLSSRSLTDAKVFQRMEQPLREARGVSDITARLKAGCPGFYGRQQMWMQ
jgi:hypothetical protein